MEAVQVLPDFEEFVVYDHMIYLSLFDISGTEQKQTEVVRINEETAEVHYLNIPLHFGRIQPGNEKLYGIEMKEGDFSAIRMLQLIEP
jgi:hypothetical protein